MSQALARTGKAPPDLSVTALYTAGTWAWARLPGAALFDHPDARRVFGATNGALTLARPFFRKPPSLKHSLVQRHVMIDRLVADSGTKAVLELAAGLSARGARLTDDPHLAYVEVDRPGVLEKKRALLERSDVGRAVLARRNLRFLPADLADPAVDLAALAPGRAGEPLVVVAEGLLMYLDAAAQAALFARVRALFAARPGAFVFDYVPPVEQPRPGVVGRFLGWLLAKATRGGAFARDTRSRDDIAAALRAADFSAVEQLEPADAPHGWQVPFLDRRTQQLVHVARVL